MRPTRHATALRDLAWPYRSSKVAPMTKAPDLVIPREMVDGGLRQGGQPRGIAAIPTMMCMRAGMDAAGMLGAFILLVSVELVIIARSAEGVELDRLSIVVAA